MRCLVRKMKKETPNTRLNWTALSVTLKILSLDRPPPVKRKPLDVFKMRKKTILKVNDFKNEKVWLVTPPSDVKLFFSELLDLVPDGSNLYIEGVYYKELEDFLSKNEAVNKSIVQKDTFWPKPNIFHIPFNRKNIIKFLQISDKYPHFAVCSHIKIYKSDKMILEWHDYLDSKYILISQEIDEHKIKDFCYHLNINYEIENI